MNFKNLCVATATAASITMSASASAISFGMDFKGYVTMLTYNGKMVENTSYASEPPYFGYRTPVSGHMILDIGLDGMRGTAEIDPILFIDVESYGRDIHFEPVDTIYGIPSNSLLLGNMLFDYGANIPGIPVSIVLDMGNLTTALMASTPGDVIRGLLTAPTENTVVNPGTGPTTLPMGPVVVATTTWNTTDADTDGDGTPGPIVQETNPSGVLPLLVDMQVDATNGDIGIGGSPIKVTVFKTFNPNFDFTEITVTCVNVVSSCSADGVPVPPVPLSPAPLGDLKNTLGGLL